MPTCYWLPITKYMYSSCGTFLYRKRLLQQNGDMRKRHLHACKLHLEQGHIYSHLSPSPPTPASNRRDKRGLLALFPAPPLPTHSPCWICVISRKRWKYMQPRIFGQDADILASHAGTTAGTVRERRRPYKLGGLGADFTWGLHGGETTSSERELFSQT
jgi:hypothetical protein